MESDVLTEHGQDCLQKLMQVWFDFERQLGRVPIIQRLENNTFSLEDYQLLLLNLRQQVIEGSRWITRCASSFDRDFADVRSEVISHAKDEHRDYEILESDYVATGGQLKEITSQPRNLGSEALHAFLMYRASQPNPIDMIGAMWIIEGLGQKMACDWATRIDELIEGNGEYTKFMLYHAENDSTHIEKMYSLIDRVCQSESDVNDILRTARVVGKLYAMQLQEIDNGG